MSDNVRVLESRPATAGAHGKCTGRLDTPLPAQVEADFRMVAAAMDKTAADLNRKLIEEFLYGRLHAIRLAANHLDVDGRKPG